MKAFKVHYETSGKSNIRTILVEDETKIGESLSKKDMNYQIGNKWSNITHLKEIPLSNVLVHDLSVEELLMLLNKQIPAEGG
ncbi:hypothetical protein [Brevibacillus laterosporus]|uniref:hypothetical protein n=1 Tax=Brevibacillus laterosporus TaxID=1465 RepID=UPI00215C0C63|nr:hypothetical protein [Brevibacillus laterosporus]MCR8994576.1 hypothetical protein [Brevibacillus laterosporus]